jgi:hypothetical protein
LKSPLEFNLQTCHALRLQSLAKLPTSRLLARNNLRTALAILNTRTRWGAGPRIVRDHLHPGLWLEVKIVVGRIHKVGAGAFECV